MFQPVIIVFFSLLPIGSAIFWNLLNCPLCYLPRIDWPGVTSPYPYSYPASYPAAYPAYSAPAAAPVVYTQQAPVVKYVRPVQYVYQYPPRQQVITVQRPGGGYRTVGGYGSSGYGSGGYGGSAGVNRGGSTAEFGSEAEFSQQAPYAKKLTAALGRAGSQNRKGSGARTGGGGSGLVAPKPATTTTTTTTEEPLVEWEDAQKGSQQSASAKEEHKSIKEGHEGSEKNFHIHEEHPPSGGTKGKGSIDDDLDDLDEDILTSSGKTGKQTTPKTDDIIVAPAPNSPKMRDDRNEFIPIGKDKRKNKIRRVKPAPPPKNLVDRHNTELKMTAALTAAWQQKKTESKPPEPFRSK